MHGKSAVNRFGLLGYPLAQSHSPWIHRLLSGISYDLYPVSPDSFADFVQKTDLAGFNVTIPYKQSILPYLSEISPTALEIGAVNTVIRRGDGSFQGDNTDAFGLQILLDRLGVSLSNRKVLILGSGGTSRTAEYVIRQRGGVPVRISRSHPVNNYGNLHLHRDAAFLVNTTPVGMFPHVEESPVDLRHFPALEGVVDVVYNPLKTRLILQAEDLHIPCIGGIGMLMAQAVRSNELFTGKKIAAKQIRQAEKELMVKISNPVLIGASENRRKQVAACLSEALTLPVAHEIPLIGGKILPVSHWDSPDEEMQKNLRMNGVLICLDTPEWNSLSAEECAAKITEMYYENLCSEWPEPEHAGNSGT